jgi:hypothetical protein
VFFDRSTAFGDGKDKSCAGLGDTGCCAYCRGASGRLLLGVIFSDKGLGGAASITVQSALPKKKVDKKISQNYNFHVRKKSADLGYKQFKFFKAEKSADLGYKQFKLRVT